MAMITSHVNKQKLIPLFQLKGKLKVDKERKMKEGTVDIVTNPTFWSFSLKREVLEFVDSTIYPYIPFVI
jgi:hypothetical protein